MDKIRNLLKFGVVTVFNTFPFILIEIPTNKSSLLLRSLEMYVFAKDKLLRRLLLIWVGYLIPNDKTRDFHITKIKSRLTSQNLIDLNNLSLDQASSNSCTKMLILATSHYCPDSLLLSYSCMYLKVKINAFESNQWLIIKLVYY